MNHIAGPNTKVEEKPPAIERTDSQTGAIEVDVTTTPTAQDKESGSLEKQDLGPSGSATPSHQQQNPDQSAVNSDANQSSSGQESGPHQLIHAQPTFIGGYPIDVPFEASKLPLDVAIYNSARSAGGDERIRKYLQAVLVVGGGALTSGMAHALESRSVNAS